MKRVGFILKVRQEMLAEYKQKHEQVWPEMLEALSRQGWHNYSLFMHDDGLLFGYFEAQRDFQSALEGMASEEINARWQKTMAPFFEALDGRNPDQGMLELTEVFHLD
ncbi:MAG: L-rhamnose mutarotase [Candidatus Alcyoniella australis]|nr:L-rhamnose mutarotase [Candidatus Alcyoniella australis]